MEKFCEFLKYLLIVAGVVGYLCLLGTSIESGRPERLHLPIPAIE